jgi:hypothetical protein
MVEVPRLVSWTRECEFKITPLNSYTIIRGLKNILARTEIKNEN